jgi:hypothetical protein
VSTRRADLPLVGLVAAHAFNFGDSLVELAFELADPQEGSDAGDEFEAVNGFGEEVVGPGVDSPFDIADFVEGGDHDDGDIAEPGIGADFFADLEAAHAGHHDIKDDDVRVEFAYAFECFDAIAGDFDAAGEGFEVGLEEFEVLFVVVNEQNGRGFAVEALEQFDGFLSTVGHGVASSVAGRPYTVWPKEHSGVTFSSGDSGKRLMSTMANTAMIWSNRFTEPSEADLLAGLTREFRRLIERVYSKCDAIDAGERRVLWYGVPWRWTIEIALRDGGPLAFVIAEPGRPQLTVPLDATDLDRLPMRRLSKGVREGILGARAVGNMLWPEWELTSNTQVDELMILVRVRAQGLVPGEDTPG